MHPRGPGVALRIGDDGLPRYDKRLADRIAAVSDAEASASARRPSASSSTTQSSSARSQGGAASSGAASDAVPDGNPSPRRRGPANALMKPDTVQFLALVSLCLLLEYMWITDLQFRSDSVEINYSLSEHLQEGIREPDRSSHELLDDSNDKNSVEDSVLFSASESSELSDAEEDVSEGMNVRRPSLSRARPSVSRAGRERDRRPAASGRERTKEKWTMSRAILCLVRMLVALPLVEVAWRKARWRLLSIAPSAGRRAAGVHNL